MKKVAFLTDRLMNGFGVDLVVTQQARLLSKNYDVTVFAINMDKKIAENLPFKVRKLLIPLCFNPLRQDYLTLKFWNEYQNLLKDFDTFIIQTPTFHSWLSKLNNFGKTIVWFHGNSPSDGYHGLKKYRANILSLLDNYAHLKHASVIIASSNFLKSQIRATLQKSTVVIPLAGDHILEFNNKLTNEQKKQLCNKYFIKKDDIIVSYIGRLDYRINPYKNTKDLFKLQNRFLQPDLIEKSIKVFALGYPENNIASEMFQHGISVIPRATEEELISVLGRSHLLISTSKWEGFNLPLIEAQTLGVPVVAYNTCAHPEVVSKNTGILANNYSNFESSILKIIENQKLHHNLSEAAKAHAKKFTWQNNVEELKKYL